MIDEHLRADPGGPSGSAPPEEWAAYADVLCAARPLARPAARRAVRALFDRYPGCLVAAVPLAAAPSVTGCLAGLRSGRGARRPVLVELVATEAGPAGRHGPVVRHGPRGSHAPHGPHGGRQWPELASLLHAWLVAGLPVAALHGSAVRTPAGPVRLRLLGGT